MTDLQLIESLKGDSQTGFVTIYHRLNKQVFFFILRYIKETDLAEEILADVFVKVWDRRMDFHAMESLRAFVYIAAKNASLNAIRSQRAKGVQEPISEYENLLTDDRDAFSMMIHAELIHAIFSEVEKLPLKQKQVFNLTYVEDKTVDEIAAELEMSPTSVYTNRSRAISTIRHLLKAKNSLMLISFLTLVGLK